MSKQQSQQGVTMLPRGLTHVALVLGVTGLVAACGGDNSSGDAGTEPCIADSECAEGQTCDIATGECVASGDTDVADTTDAPDAPDDAEDVADAPDEQDVEVDNGPDEPVEPDEDVPDPGDVEEVDEDVDVELDVEVAEEVAEEVDVDPCEDSDDPACLCPDFSTPPPAQVNPWLAYTATPAGGFPVLYLVRADGTDGVEVPAAPPTSPFLAESQRALPAWSWDGTKLAYRSLDFGVSTELPTLRVVDLTTGEFEVVEHGLGRITSIAWGPDDASLYVTGSVVPTDRADIFQLFFDGSPAVNTTSTATLGEQAFSFARPDLAVYQVTEGTEQYVAVWDLCSEDRTRETPLGERVDGRPSLDWSGGKLVYTRLGPPDEEGNPTAEVVLYERALETPARTVIGGSQMKDAALSTDGSFAVYVEGSIPNDIFLLLRLLPDPEDPTDPTRRVTNDALGEVLPVISRVESDTVTPWFLAE